MSDQTVKPIRRRRSACAAVIALTAAFTLAACAPRYHATPENEAAKAQLVDGALTFVLLHEAGHMMIKQLALPKIGSEEDLADHFAAAALTGVISGDDADPVSRQRMKVSLVSAAFYFDQDHNANWYKPTAWADEHGESEQRAYNIICMLYGSSPHEFGQMARLAKLPEQRLQSCPQDSADNQKSWQKLMTDAYEKSKENDILAIKPTSVEGMILQQAVRETTIPEARKVGAVYNPIPENLGPAIKARLEKARAASQHGHAIPLVMGVMELAPNPYRGRDKAHPDTNYAYRLVGDACIGKDGKPIENAWWDPSTGVITFCYGLVAKLEDTSEMEVASERKQLKKVAPPSV